MTEETLSDHVWNGYALGRERGDAIGRRALRRVAYLAGIVDGIVDTVRTHVHRVRSEQPT